MKKPSFYVVVSLFVSFLFVTIYTYGATTIDTNIDTGGTLTVTGAISASSTLQTTGAVTFYNDLIVDTDTFIVDSTNNKIGIGSTSPTEKLSLDGGNFLHKPGTPTTIGNWDPNDTNVMDGAISVYVSGKYAYVVGAGSKNLAIVDISDPTTPTTVGNWDPNDTNIMSSPYSVYVSGKYAYVGGMSSDNLAIVDISDPTNPTTVGNWDPNDTNIMDGVYSVYVSGKYAYVAGSNSDNMAIVDISDPTNPTTIGNWDPNDTNVMDSAKTVYVSGRYAYVGGIVSDNMVIVDISDPTTPVTVANWDPNDTDVMGGAQSIYISGKYAYVAGSSSDNMAIVDISDPTNPTTVANWDPNDTNITDNTPALFVSGKYVYIVGYNSDNMAIVDISGLDVPSANIGDISASSIEVSENVIVGNNLYAQGALNVGPGGIYSGGELSIYASSTQPSLKVIQDLTGDIFNLYDGSTEVLTVLDGGNLGLGTSTPNWLMQINGTKPSFTISDSGASTDNKHWLFSSMGGNLYIGTSTDIYATSTPPALTILNDGNIGIASSSPKAMLSVGNSSTATTTIDFSKPCFRMNTDVGGVMTQLYYYPCLPQSIGAQACLGGWATSTSSCY